MSLEQEQFEQRFARIREIEALGFRPYGQRFEFTHTVPQVLADYAAKTAEEIDAAHPEVRVAGRVLTIRRMGKAGLRSSRSTSRRTRLRRANSRFTSCWTWATSSEWKATCSVPERANCRFTWRNSPSFRRI